MSIVEICLGGDAMLGRSFNDLLNRVGDSYVWGNAIRAWKDSDLFLINLETTITDAIQKDRKTFNYKLHPRFKDVLKAGRVDYCSLANNHILDFKDQGLHDTIDHLRELRIKYAGAGTLSEAMKPAILFAKGMTIAVFSASDHYRRWAATNQKPGIWYVDAARRNRKNLLIEVEKIRPQVDIIITSLHWGPNWQKEVDSHRESFAKELVHSGVDIIHGHSAHHVQPAERIGNSLVTYSLGSLVDDYAIDASYRNDLGVLIKVYCGRNGVISAQSVPIKIKDMQVNLAKGSEAQFVKSIVGF